MTDDGAHDTNAVMMPAAAGPAPAAEVTEFPATTLPGWPALWASIAGLIVGITLASIGAKIPAELAIGIVLIVVASVTLAGLTAVAPGEARVVQLLGRYTGTIRAQGLQWVSPLTKRHKISTKVRNHETGLAKVNDADGNPIDSARRPWSATCWWSCAASTPPSPSSTPGRSTNEAAPDAGRPAE